MTLDTLDNYISSYFSKIQINREVKGANNVTCKIIHSKKSLSLYVEFGINVCDKFYSRRIRISDHLLYNSSTQSNHFKGIIINKGEKIETKDKKKINSFIISQLKKLIVLSRRHAIATFTA